jgi:NADH dehydrogenase subunit K (EC 1.6.5.3)
LSQRGRHLSEPEERHHPVDVDRTHAVGGELQFHCVFPVLDDTIGQVFVFFILTVAAAESAIGLAILVVLFRNRRTINVADLDTLKG